MNKVGKKKGGKVALFNKNREKDFFTKYTKLNANHEFRMVINENMVTIPYNFTLGENIA